MRSSEQLIHRGLTLVETVVSMTIIGILAAIVLPAIQAVRESARRTQCQNNLHQTALAVQAFESSATSLPPLYFGTSLKQPRHAFDEFHFHSWRSAILPQLGERGLRAALSLSANATDPMNQIAVNTTVPLFVCPSTSTPTTVVPIYSSAAKPVPGTAARSDYEAIGGIQHPQSGSTPAWDLSDDEYGAWGTIKYNVATLQVVGSQRGRLRDITDGLSNTMLIGERAGGPDLHRRGEAPSIFPQAAPERGISAYQTAWGLSTHFPELLLQSDSSINENNSIHLFSFHPAGCYVALADGSVRFLGESTDRGIVVALVTRAGHETIVVSE